MTEVAMRTVAEVFRRIEAGETVELGPRVQLTPGPTDSWGTPTCSMRAEGFDAKQVRREHGFWIEGTNGHGAIEIIQRALILQREAERG